MDATTVIAEGIAKRLLLQSEQRKRAPGPRRERILWLARDALKNMAGPPTMAVMRLNEASDTDAIHGLHIQGAELRHRISAWSGAWSSDTLRLGDTPQAICTAKLQELIAKAEADRFFDRELPAIVGEGIDRFGLPALMGEAELDDFSDQRRFYGPHTPDPAITIRTLAAASRRMLEAA